MLLTNQVLAAGPSVEIERVGRVQQDQLTEVSGLAVSRRLPDRWWALNDSGHPAVLYAIDGRGRPLQATAVSGAQSVDWEDIASYRHHGEAWLAIGDIGDNFSWRSHVSLWVLPEPEDGATASAPAREIRFSFEDGPRDCEALAADPANDRFLLIDKGRQPAGLYSLPMQPPPGPVLARRIADLPRLWNQPPPPAEPLGAQHYRGAATAMDLSADGRRLLVLTYTHLALFERAADEDWATAIRRPPPLLRLPRVKILEAAGFDADGRTALISREAVQAEIYRWSGRLPAPVPP